MPVVLSCGSYCFAITVNAELSTVAEIRRRFLIAE